MKNQYFGDVNDYRKYGLLRLLGATSGCRVAVCWMLTADDDRTDGRFVDYLAKPGQWRGFDPPLYQALARAVGGGRREVAVAEEDALLPRATYWDAPLTDERRARDRYFAGFWRSAADAELVFFDPDNGIEIASVAKGRKSSSKFVYWDELEAAAARDKSVLVYQHFPRRPRDGFVRDTMRQLHERLSPAALCAFRTPRVVFFLAARARDVALLDAVDGIGQVWGSQLTAERHATAAAAGRRRRRAG